MESRLTEPERPRPESVIVKSDSGSLPVPRLWNGPPRFSDSGVVSVLDPEGLTVRLKLMLPLLTLWGAPKVCLSSVRA